MQVTKVKWLLKINVNFVGVIYNRKFTFIDEQFNIVEVVVHVGGIEVDAQLGQVVFYLIVDLVMSVVVVDCVG